MALPNNWNTLDILRLSFSKRITTYELIKVVNDFQSLEQFSKSNHHLRHKLFADEIFDSNDLFYDESNRQLDNTIENNCKIISIWDDEYPELLRTIAYPPPLLFVKGQLQASDSLCIAIVGTRRASTYGKLCTERFAEFFARHEVVIVSGLAYGIDTTAHLATIKGGGITYAVIASGIDKLSPSISVKNAEKIVESGGAIITEYKMGTNANLSSFPQRNRIIAGLSKAVLVVESAIKGGSLITAKIAFNEGREVYAIPGNITSKTSEGTNDLIRSESAKIAVSPEQLLTELGFDKISHADTNKRPVFSSSNAEKLYSMLNFEPIHIDMLMQQSEIDISNLLVVLLELEFNGYIRQLPGKYYIRNN